MRIDRVATVLDSKSKVVERSARGFNSLILRSCGGRESVVDCLTVTQVYVGSNPTGHTKERG